MNGNDMSSIPLVSVIINCYNGQAYLKEAIDSVIAQTYTNWELVFWDNQSTDLSSSIVNSYTDGRIKYFLSKNHTKLGEARNLAVERAKGKWIGFLDCDDLWKENKLEIQLERVLVGDEISMVYGQTCFFSEGDLSYIDITRKKLPEGDIFGELAKGNFISLSSALVLREEYIRVNGIEKNYNQAEDYDLFIKLSYDSKIGVVNQEVIKYRIHASSLSVFQKDLAFTESIEILLKYLPDRRALIGLNHWSSLYMLWCISRIKITKQGVRYFLKYGSMLGLLKLTLKLSVKRISKSFFLIL